MKSSFKQLMVALVALVFFGLGQSVLAQTSNVSEAERVQLKEAAKQPVRSTSRTDADLEAIKAHRVEVSKKQTVNKTVSRDQQASRTAQKTAAVQNGTKGSTAERDARVKLQQDERRAQKASYLNSKMATEPSTKEKQELRTNTMRQDGAKKENR